MPINLKLTIWLFPSFFFLNFFWVLVDRLVIVLIGIHLMVTGGVHQDDGERNPAATALSRGGGATGSWGNTTVSGQSVSTSGSVGSPSSRSEQAMTTPASDSTFLRLNHLDIHADDAATQDAAASVFLSLPSSFFFIYFYFFFKFC